MEKITDKIAALQPPGSSHFFCALEFFPPKTAMGFDNLRGRLERMARALRPLFVNVTWGAGGSTAVKSFELADMCQRELGLTTCLHLTCTNTSRRQIDETLDGAKAMGIRNILALRGDPPRRAEYRDEDEAAQSRPDHDRNGNGDDNDGGFNWAVDLVRHIRQRHGDYFCIGVAAYPEGHADGSHPLGQSVEHDCPYLMDKVAAGAGFIMTQLFFDVEAYERFEKTLREHPSGLFKTIPILPGLMPIQSYETIKRTSRLSHAKIPPALMARLDAVKGDDEQVKAVGVEILSEIVERLKETRAKAASTVPQGFHFYTLNLEKAVSFIVERTGLIPPGPAMEDEGEDEEAVVDDAPAGAAPPPRFLISRASPNPRRRSTVGSDPRNRVIVRSDRGAGNREYETTALEASVPAELVNTRANTLAISEGEGVLGREATWDDFPNGRFGDARSPAYGQVDGYGVSLHVTMSQARQLWGAPRRREDIGELFIRHLEGDLAAIPWSEEELSDETRTIKDQLARLNRKGWWTLASQPAVNGLRSSDPTFGWGPQNGFVFQKAFVEFFVPDAAWRQLLRKLTGPDTKDVVCFYAANAKGDFISSDTSELAADGAGSQGGVNGKAEPATAAAAAEAAPRKQRINAVTWGVFPGKEIVTPTIIEEVSFRAWREEAFGIWSEWAKTYGKGSESQRLLEQVRAESWLVNVIHHEYIERDALWNLLLEAGDEGAL